MGSALKVELGKELNKGDKVDVKVEYSTTDECTALGWLTPEQVSLHCCSLSFPSSSANYSISLGSCRIVSDRQWKVRLLVQSGSGDSLPLDDP